MSQRWTPSWNSPSTDMYLPLRYAHLTKNPRQRFIQVAWLKDDLYVALLAFSLLADWLFPIHAIGVVLLSLGMWITYETGYHENDILGARHELDPMLPDNFSEVRNTMPKVAPWLWALGATILGAPFITAGYGRPMVDSFFVIASWMAVLVAIRLTFALFNRLAKPHRVIPHLLLQVGKYFGYAAVTALTPVGAALLAAQTMYRWFPYINYRWAKSKTFPPKPLQRTRLAVFLCLAIPCLLIVDHSKGQLVLFALISLLLGRRVVGSALNGVKNLRPSPLM